MQPIGNRMDPLTTARREVALEVEKLALEFEASDNAAFNRSRMVAWIVTAVVTERRVVRPSAGERMDD